MIGEFFVNVWNGIVANKDTIFTAIGSAEFIALISTIVAYFRNMRTTKKNTVSNQALTTALSDMMSFKDTLNNAITINIDVKSKLEEQDKHIAILEEQNKLLLSKLNTVLEVQSIVYALSIKDVTTRNTVLNLLANAKHDELAHNAALKEQLIELQKHVSDTVSSVVDEVSSVVKQAENVLESGSAQVDEIVKKADTITKNDAVGVMRY